MTEAGVTVGYSHGLGAPWTGILMLLALAVLAVVLLRKKRGS